MTRMQGLAVRSAAAALRSTLCCSFMLSAAYLPTQAAAEWPPRALAAASDVEGFRLGMSMQQALQLAAGKGFEFGNPVRSGYGWSSYRLTNDGPDLSFCGDVLVSAGRSYDATLHEFANLLKQWMNSFGEPEPETSPSDAQGSPASSLRYKWPAEDNVTRHISFSQQGSQAPQISLSYSYRTHPCIR